MRTAIDRMSTGIEEVDIIQFDGYKAEKRFICPECGEYVIPVVGERSYFRHYSKSELDCDRRVDGFDAMTFYERVGLPIYLLKENNSFSLNVGFYALGSESLQKAQANNLKITIEGKTDFGVSRAQYLVDYTFFEDDITIKPLSFIPCFGNDYLVSVSGIENTTNKIIKNKWSKYADGFLRFGAIFTYSESKGKKLRKNDTISTNVEYYLLSVETFREPPKGITSNYISSFKVGQKRCYVHSIVISPTNEREFKLHKEYIWTNYRIHLEYTKPELIQVWPPAIKTDDINYTTPLKSQKNVVCKIKSNSCTPKVYRYIDKTYYEVDVTTDYNQCKYINIHPSKELQPLSVDRKYLANAQFFVSGACFETNSCIDIQINGSDLSEFKNQINNDNVTNQITLSGNIVFKVMQVLDDNQINKHSVEIGKITTINISKEPQYLLLYAKDIDKLLCIYKKRQVSSETPLRYVNSNIIKKAMRSPYVDIPMKYRNLFFENRGSNRLNKLIKPLIVNGRIPQGILKILIDGGW